MHRFLSSFVFAFISVCQLAVLSSCKNPSNTVTDIDGNVYQTVQIGTQVWMAENLKTTRYRNGDLIPTNLSNTDWDNATTGAYSIYDNKPENDKTYGKLYNWYAVVDSRNLCPAGWHVPSDAEWTTLLKYLGGDSITVTESIMEGGKMEAERNVSVSIMESGVSIAGGKMKAVSNLWQSPNTGATNESGFSGLPGGCRGDDGTYDVIGYKGGWWSSTEKATDIAWNLLLESSNDNTLRGDPEKQIGISVRCIRD
jgi:uncharacterized protein (TIGR02145 family)